MNSASPKTAQWSTAFGVSANTLPWEIADLQAHVSSCTTAQSSRLRWGHSAHNVHSFLSGRVVSTLLVLGVALAAVASVL